MHHDQTRITFTVTLSTGDTLVMTHHSSLPSAHGHGPLEQQIARAGADLSAALHRALVQHLTSLGHCAPGLVEEPDATQQQRRTIERLWSTMESEELDWYSMQAGTPRRERLTYAGAERLIAALRDGPRYDPYATLSPEQRAELDARDAQRPFRPLVTGHAALLDGGDHDPR